MVILACRAGRAFAEEVVAECNRKQFCQETIQRGRMEIGRFADGELDVNIQSHLRRKTIHLFQGRDPRRNIHEDIFELFEVLDAIKRSGVGEINIYCPYMPYGRQDRKARGRQPITAKLMHVLVDGAAGGDYKRLITSTLHTAAEQGFSERPVDELPVTHNFADYLVNSGLPLDQLVIISPDEGGVPRVTTLARYFGAPVAFMTKQRHSPNESEVTSITGNVKGRIPILVDDIIDTGGSLLNAYRSAIAAGSEADGFALCTHGLFSRKSGKRAEDELRRSGLRVVTTNTIYRTPKYLVDNADWLSVISLASNYADAIRCNQHGHSMGSCIKHWREEVADSINRRMQ